MHRVYIAPRLRELGFTGSGGRYVLPDAESWLLAFFQSRLGWTGAILFTVNLSRITKQDWADYEEIWDRPAGRRPEPIVAMGSSGPGITLRIGNLMGPRGEDRWWELSPDRSPEAVADELVAAIRDVGMVWLQGGPADPYGVLALWPG